MLLYIKHLIAMLNPSAQNSGYFSHLKTLQAAGTAQVVVFISSKKP
jgi:hypothetical protein